jgi:flagellar biosynthetic protein FlhB
MAEEQQGQEKTEEATQRKLEKSREEGQVARSRELNSVAIVTFGAVAALIMMPEVSSRILDLVRKVFADAGQKDLHMPQYLGQVAVEAIWTLLPFVLVMFVAGIVSSLGVGGLVLSSKALAPKLNRLSPLKGFGRMFSSKSLVELFKSIAKFVLIAGVAIAVLNTLLSDLLNLGALPVEVAVSQGISYVGWALLLIGMALLLVAAIDVPFQIAQHKKQLKMTKQEVRDEMKDSEGKPEVKAKIRALQQQVANRKMLEHVPEADVIITNPEHFSVAVKYDSDSMAAPILLAKGVDLMAFRIREIAQSHDVPLVASPALARAVFYSTELGEEVPAGLYMAIAQVLAYVYQLDQYRRGQMKQPPTLASIDVPAEFAELDPNNSTEDKL